MICNICNDYKPTAKLYKIKYGKYVVDGIELQKGNTLIVCDTCKKDKKKLLHIELN